MPQNPPNPQKRQLRLELPADPSATYSNTVMISHTPTEVIFDFIQIIPNDNRARVQKRIVMTPTHAKMFLNALQENIEKFEKSNGEINLPPRPQSLAEQLFGAVKSGSSDDENDENEDNNEQPE